MLILGISASFVQNFSEISPVVFAKFNERQKTYGHHLIFIIENIIYLGVIELKRR